MLFEIQEQVIQLNFQWKSYFQIFILPYQLIKDSVLNLTFSTEITNIAPLFFSYIKKTLQESMLLTIVRLFDPAYSFPSGIRTSNLSYKYLIDRLKLDFSENELIVYLKKVDSFHQQQGKLLFKYRDKLLAHNDLLTIREEDYHKIFEPIFQNTNTEGIIEFINDLTNDFGRLLSSKRIIPENMDDFYAHPYLINFKEINTDANILISSFLKASSK